jgi:hypothetical protein
MIAAELIELVFPLVPELGKAVEKQHQLSAARFGVVQRDAVHGRRLVGDREGRGAADTQHEGDEEGSHHRAIVALARRTGATPLRGPRRLHVIDPNR